MANVLTLHNIQVNYFTLKLYELQDPGLGIQTFYKRLSNEEGNKPLFSHVRSEKVPV